MIASLRSKPLGKRQGFRYQHVQSMQTELSFQTASDGLHWQWSYSRGADEIGA
jgi:hypothetical protein